jgi:hypothetical protein
MHLLEGGERFSEDWGVRDDQEINIAGLEVKITISQ